MIVTKKMIHEELIPYYGQLSIIGALFSRKWGIKIMNSLSDKKKGTNIDGLECDEIFIPGSDEENIIRVRVYRPVDHEGELPCMLYLHGGGYVMGNVEDSNEIIKLFIETRPCVVISPDYRRALDEPYPAAFNDCYETLLWAKANSSKLNISADQFIVAGHSAGGGLTAAVTLKARDTKDVHIAFQMPFYPMIDDKQPSDPKRYIKTAVWDTEANKLGWNSYLADIHKKGDEIPPYAAPARNTDYSDFPPTISFVGNMEPFYWETLAYVAALKKANVDVTFKEYEGCFHGFEQMAKGTKIAKDGLDFSYNSFAVYFDKYITSATK